MQKVIQERVIKSRLVRYLGPPFIKDNFNVQDLAELLQQSEKRAILMMVLNETSNWCTKVRYAVELM